MKGFLEKGLSIPQSGTCRATRRASQREGRCVDAARLRLLFPVARLQPRVQQQASQGLAVDDGALFDHFQGI